MPERAPIRTAAPVALLAAGLLLTGCGTQADSPAAKPAAVAPTSAAPAPAAEPGLTKPAAAAGSLGGAGTACVLPVAFSLAKDWKPKAIETPEDPEFAALTRQGPAFAHCEVDAKPAGNIGFLRVWTVPKDKGPARAALEAFVKAEKKSSGVLYKKTRAGALPAVEVVYTVRSEALDEKKQERAFAVDTPKGPVIVHLGGLDSEEHRAMLPAYELAKRSLTVR
ncbi:lipoprotein [Streptomyces sp. NPDC053431]|uniref:lipoprotein n=1 Tax=Streptomyces sp. NPDC053431 TaxID=3365703 RepID=UPI0037D7D29A